MTDDWWPLTWIPPDLTWSEKSIDWPTAEVTHNGKTVWVDDFAGGINTLFCFYVGLTRNHCDSDAQVELPHDELVLRCFLHEYFEHADKGEWPSDFARRWRCE